MNNELANNPDVVAAVNYLSKRNLTINDRLEEYDELVDELIAKDKATDTFSNMFASAVVTPDKEESDELEQEEISIEDTIEENSTPINDMNDLF